MFSLSQAATLHEVAFLTRAIAALPRSWSSFEKQSMGNQMRGGKREGAGAGHPTTRARLVGLASDTKRLTHTIGAIAISVGGEPEVC
jgi:hypothetical protein